MTKGEDAEESSIANTDHQTKGDVHELQRKDKPEDSDSGVDETDICGDGTGEHSSDSVRGAMLSAHDIHYTVKVSGGLCKKATDKKILSSITGVFKPGLNAILGPTGSGKTSFLNALADRLDKKQLEGTILVNGKVIPENFKCMVGYVVQDDVLIGTLTVRENFAFSAALRLPQSIKASDRKDLIEDVIKELGLQNCADTKIGTAFIRGVSGGERKRCNIGMELIISPPVLFLDEPTSGLDANTANSVLMFLRRLADKDRTIIFSIHQPRYSIFKLFDNLVLLSKGQTAFHGPAQEALDFFEQQGYTCQEHNNPPDFFLDIINADQTTLQDLAMAKQRDSGLEMEEIGQQEMHEKIVQGYKDSVWNKKLQAEVSELYAAFEAKGGHGGEKPPAVDYATSFGNQIKVVAGRTLRDLIRNPQTGMTTIGTAIFFSLILIGLYWQIDDDPLTGFQNRGGVLVLTIFAQMFFNLAAMESYVKEKIIFMHENVSGFYRTSVYFLVKIFCDILPIRLVAVLVMALITYFGAGLRLTQEGFFYFTLAAFLAAMAAAGICFLTAFVFQTFAAGQLILNVVFVNMMIFSGYVINFTSIVNWLHWLQYFSIIKYGLACLYINEFKDRNFCNTNATLCKEGNLFLTEQGVDFKTDWDLGLNYMALFLIAVATFCLTYVQLRRMKRHN